MEPSSRQEAGTSVFACRGCGSVLTTTMVDLGSSPLANSYLLPEQLEDPEPRYPLRVYVCDRCLLVQLPASESPEHIFEEYSYLSSYSESWLEHARRYAGEISARLGLGARSFVIELASNDGYLLQYFVQRGIRVLGVEPARNIAKIAQERGVPTEIAFFGRKTAERLAAQGHRPDLIVANNVLAHVPDLHDFLGGIALLLQSGGVATLEFPHLMRLLAETEFDTIYHEHYSYFSLTVLTSIMDAHGLEIQHVEEIPTHGGSLRLYVGNRCLGDPHGLRSGAVEAVLSKERDAGLHRLETYRAFGGAVQRVRDDALSFLRDARSRGQSVVGYGAPAKGNTFLNYCGIDAGLLAYTVDRSPHKQGRVLPGTHIPVFSPQRIAQTRPDYVLILAWNIKGEIMEQLAEIRSWNGKFVVAVPRLEVLP